MFSVNLSKFKLPSRSSPWPAKQPNLPSNLPIRLSMISETAQRAPTVVEYTDITMHERVVAALAYDRDWSLKYLKNFEEEYRMDKISTIATENLLMRKLLNMVQDVVEVSFGQSLIFRSRLISGRQSEGGLNGVLERMKAGQTAEQALLQCTSPWPARSDSRFQDQPYNNQACSFDGSKSEGLGRPEKIDVATDFGHDLRHAIHQVCTSPSHEAQHGQ